MGLSQGVNNPFVFFGEILIFGSVSVVRVPPNIININLKKNTKALISKSNKRFDNHSLGCGILHFQATIIYRIFKVDL